MADTSVFEKVLTPSILEVNYDTSEVGEADSVESSVVSDVSHVQPVAAQCADVATQPTTPAEQVGDAIFEAGTEEYADKVEIEQPSIEVREPTIGPESATSAQLPLLHQEASSALRELLQHESVTRLQRMTTVIIPCLLLALCSFLAGYLSTTFTPADISAHFTTYPERLGAIGFAAVAIGQHVFPLMWALLECCDEQQIWWLVMMPVVLVSGCIGAMCADW